MEQVRVAITVEKSKLIAYKKWLLDHGYRSPSQHLNEVIENIIAQEKQSEERENETMNS